MNIFLIVVGCIFSLIVFNRLRIRLKIKKEISDWQLGDVIVLKKNITRNIDNNEFILEGWNINNFFVDDKKGVHCIDYEYLNYNKSALWRRHYKSCELFMGKSPSFDPRVTINNKKGNITIIHGKSIESLTETECQIYLNECLKNEDYETAELIKKQMGKYR